MYYSRVLAVLPLQCFDYNVGSEGFISESRFSHLYLYYWQLLFAKPRPRIQDVNPVLV